MSQKDEFHNLDNPADGLLRELASGVTTRIFSGEQAMLSVVTLAPHAQGTLHHHPEEQWGVLLDGSAIRVQGGEEIPVGKGDFWRTPGNVPHTMRAGPDGARVLDIFSPPRSTVSRDPGTLIFVFAGEEGSVKSSWSMKKRVRPGRATTSS
jgi:quercetin dioxygenase-like cupin family protein